jgi:hypothetical protein
LDSVSRKNKNILDINLDLNSVALCFVYSIKNNLKRNQDEKMRKIVPELKSKIDHLSQNALVINKIKENLQQKQSEFSKLNRRFQQGTDRYQMVAEEEEKKTSTVFSESEKFKAENGALSLELTMILEETAVICIKKLKILKEKEISKLSEEIGFIANDTKAKDKASNS